MNPEIRRTVLRKIVHGVYVAGVKDDQHLNALTVTWICQVSFQPPLVMVAIRKDGVSYGMIRAGRVFTLNLLSSGQKELAQHFLKPAHLGADKLAGMKYRLGRTGAPILEETAAYVECEVRKIYDDAGDHALVVGEVIEAGLHRDVEPLTLKETGWHYGG
ncbi:MAG: flavin reductase family protein [Candidatus Omnitrophica bacterium]|nr:flavin reductase family protein [Candidatus Omnitrophota bacterium]